MTYKERYKKIVKSDWFRDSYSGMSIGETIQIKD